MAGAAKIMSPFLVIIVPPGPARVPWHRRSTARHFMTWRQDSSERAAGRAETSSPRAKRKRHDLLCAVTMRDGLPQTERIALDGSVPKASIAGLSFSGHLRQQGLILIDIVVDDDVVF